MQPTRPESATPRIMLQTLLHMTEADIAGADKLTVARLLSAVEGKLTRERNKGTMRHWSYDLDRHLKLRSVRDRLRQRLESIAKGAKKPAHFS